MRYSFDAIDAMYPLRSRGADSDPIGLAHRLHASNESIARWRRDGLAPEAADVLAVKLGMHPVDIWPSWFDDAEDDERCPWCFEFSFGGRYCDQTHRALSFRERNQHRWRSSQWWKRLDLYRETVVIPEQIEEVA